jgi:hypothetical protein
MKYEKLSDMKKVDSDTARWIEAVLTNDENSSDEELVEHFMNEGGLIRWQAEVYVSKRTYCRNRIFIEELCPTPCAIHCGE